MCFSFLLWQCKALFGFFFSSLNFHHSSLITHYSSLITLNITPVWHHHSIFFTLFVGPILVTRCNSFFLVSKLTEPSKKKKETQNRSNQWKKEKKKKETQNKPNQWKKEKKKKKPRIDQTSERKKKKKKKKKKKNRTANEEKKGKKKKVKSGQQLSLGIVCGSLCVFNYNIVIELWVMETKNSQNVFSVSITHNSKIRELSDGNRVMEIELWLPKQPFCYGPHYFWVMSYGNWDMSYRNC